MGKEDLVAMLYSVVLILPLSALLIGRDLSAHIVESSSIIDSQMRVGGALTSAAIATGLVLVSFYRGVNINHSLLNSLIILNLGTLFVLIMFLSVYGYVNSNQSEYIAKDAFKYLSIVIYFCLGLGASQNVNRIIGVLKYITFFGGVIVVFELVTYVYSSSLSVRYGSGLTLMWLPISMGYFSYRNKPWAIFLTIFIAAASVIASESRLQLVIYTLTLVFFMFRSENLKTGFGRLKFAAAFFVFFVLLFSFLAFGFSERLNSRLSIGVDAISILIDKNSDLTRIDPSILGRILEVQSVITSVRNSIIGNGLGASFENERAVLFNKMGLTANDHYIHITPVSFYLHGGFLLLITVASLLILFAVKSLKTNSKPLGLICLLLFIGTLLKFPVSSGAYNFSMIFLSFILGASFFELRRSQFTLSTVNQASCFILTRD